jgi:hypothetical protein
MVLAHTSKANAENPQSQPPAGPIGSVFLGNLSRLNWYARREPSEGDIRISFTCTKNTFGPDLPPVAMRVRFDRDGDRTLAAHVEQIDAAGLTTPTGAERRSLWRRMADELRAGAMRPVDLAKALGAAPDVVGRTARAHRDTFYVNPGKRGVQGVIGLLDRRTEDGHE